MLSKQSTELHRLVRKDVRSPDGKVVIRCWTSKAPDKNGDEAAKLYAIRGKKRLALGELVRSGEVFWRPDSKVAIFNDDQGSNYSEFRLIRVDPTMKDVKRALNLVQARWHSEFRSGEIMHDYTTGKGWLNDTDLLVSVYADGMPRGKEYGSAIDFCRGYVLDTDTIRIKREVRREELKKEFGVKVCW